MTPARTMCNTTGALGEGVTDERARRIPPSLQQWLYRLDHGAAVSAVICHEQGHDAARRRPRLQLRALARQISWLWRADRAVGLRAGIVRADGGAGRGHRPHPA